MTIVTAAEPYRGKGTAAEAGSALPHYATVRGRFDEFLEPGGAPRMRWKRVAAELAELGPDGLMARRSELARLLRNEGATYNDTGHLRSRRQPWTLDPCPLVVEGTEWAALESAVAQRVALLDLVLTDLYGDQSLLGAGRIPAELVLGHPAFLRPCAGVGRPGGHGLFLTAVDVVRDGHGEFRAIGDHVQAPSGLGYALVNRTILSRVLPNLHGDSDVEHLAGFFRSIRAEVVASAPEGVDSPRVVILTPGPLSETYFEHAYLASYLGYSLVEGRDLVVANNRLWLRTLGGLDPVDVVIRRVDDDWCDPVELRPNSLIGVPGLLEVARRGRVTVVNPIGCGVVEDPALAGLLDTLAPIVLGEELALRGPETWWCGEASQLSHVVANLDRLVVHPVRPSPTDRSVVASTLPATDLDDLRERIRARPERWVGQETIEPSTMPTVNGSGVLEPRPVVLRTFAIAQSSSTGNGNGSGHRGSGESAYGFTILPGGLTRVGTDPSEVIVSSRSGGTSKDTWVTSARPGLRTTRLHPARTSVGLPAAPTTAAPLPGRVAAQLFVLGRTAEHAELVIRLIRTVLARLDQPLGMGADGGAEYLQILLSALGTVSGFDPVSEPDTGHDRTEARSEPTEAATVADRANGAVAGEGVSPADVPSDRRALELLLDARVDGSLASSLGLLVDAAYSVREQLSSDTWQLIGDIEEDLARLRNRPPTQLLGVQQTLQRLLQALLALSGLIAENMERDSIWLFLDAGRRLERAHSLVRLLRTVLVRRRSDAVEDLLLESLLKTSESLIIYRLRTGSAMLVSGTVDLLVYDEANPRSVIYQLDRLFQHLSDLAETSSTTRAGDQRELAQETVAVLRRSDGAKLAVVDVDTNSRPELDAVLGQVDGLLAELLDDLRHSFFANERLSALAVGRSARGIR